MSTQYDDPLVSLERPIEGVALLRFADPGRQNQLCWKAIDTMAGLLEECIEQGVGVVVLASDLPGQWLHHAWLSDFAASLEGRQATSEGSGWSKCIELLSHAPLVSIAAINGDAMGGGCELAWACDFRIAERQARFCQLEINLGITPGMGGLTRLNALVGRTLASEMVLKGEWVNAERIYQAGGINRLVGEGEALTTALTWAEDLAQKPSQALQLSKQLLADAQELPMAESIKNEQGSIQYTAANALQLIKQQQAHYDEGGTAAALYQAADS